MTVYSTFENIGTEEDERLRKGNRHGIDTDDKR